MTFGIIVKWPDEKTESTMECYKCNGSGQMTVEEKKRNDLYKSLWCKCYKNPDFDGMEQTSTYYENYEHKGCVSKHHWHCDDCGKVTQIG